MSGEEVSLNGKPYPPLLINVPADQIKTEAPTIKDELPQDKVIATVGLKKPKAGKTCTSKEGCYTYTWKNVDNPPIKVVNGQELLFVEAKPYYEPGTGGDLHGVVGGLTQTFDFNVANRPDISSATHFVFYAYIESGSAYISVEFFDHDPGTPGAKDGFSTTPNLDALHGEKPGITEQQLLERSGGQVNMQEFQQHRYDGYRYRIYGSDGWKAQKLLVSGHQQLYRIEIPIDKAFVERYFINTGFGNEQWDVNPGEFERLQFVTYVTEKPGEPVTPYKRGLTLKEYHDDPTAYQGRPEGYKYQEDVRVGIGTEVTFIQAPKRTGIITITPVREK
ncbi:MAG: hypothetical protein NT099_08070 [Candidatus Saganbacteria bacterium]|nr:hypothetical protein [Candidatus Saganbacteria bacterium]